MVRSIESSVASLLTSDPSGRSEPWAEIYASVAPTLLSWIALHLHGTMRQRIDPSDIAQDTWMRAMESINSYDPERGPFAGWLIGIARNQLRSAFQQISLRREASGGTSAMAHLDNHPDDVTSATKRIASSDALRVFIEFVREQDEADQILVVACGLERVQLADAALQLGISVEAAGKRWQRLRQRLATNPMAARLVGAVDS